LGEDGWVVGWVVVDCVERLRCTSLMRSNPF
jgi:hypothetical protein